MAPRFEEIAANSLALLDRLYDGLYVGAFPDANERESLANMRRYVTLKDEGWYGDNNYHILAAFDGDVPVAISVSDYLAEANAGVIEFLMAAPEARGGGIGSEMLAETERCLAEDAKRVGRQLDFIAAEMNDPFAVDSLNDNLDPFQRLRIWDRWGYKRIAFHYVQPALSEDQSAVTNLILAAKPSRGDVRTLPSTSIKAFLRGYMRYAMRIEDPEDLQEYVAMREQLNSKRDVPITSLSDYVGYDPKRPLTVREITEPGDQLDETLAIYRSAFPGSATEIDSGDIRDFLAVPIASRSPSYSYHFWAIAGSGNSPSEGIASFFGFTGAGFGGYVALSGSLKGTGRFPLIVARIEERIRRDSPAAIGWLIECAPEKEPFFAQFGFRTVDFSYRQPPLNARPSYSVDQSPELRLMYKPLGQAVDVPQLDQETFWEALSEIFSVVYGVEPAKCAFLADMHRQSHAWNTGNVPFREPPMLK